MTAPAPAIVATDVAKLFGDVLALQRVDLTIDGGIVGLLGPNSAGKSTFMRLVVGELRPSRGTIRVLGGDPFRDAELKAGVGFAPEGDPFYEDMTGRGWVEALLSFHGLEADAAAELAGQALARVGMERLAERRIDGMSRGMRQRLKIAQALAHRPRLIVLDEPLNGCDPVVKASLKDLFRELAAAGATLLLSSHDLAEMEAMTDRIILINHGRVAAHGRIDELRSLLDRHPRALRVTLAPGATAPGRPLETLAGDLVSIAGVEGVTIERPLLAVRVETRDVGAFYDALGAIVIDRDLPVRSVTTVDADLRSVFRYVVADLGGEA